MDAAVHTVSFVVSIPATMPDRPWWGEFVCSGSSAVLAYVFTNPVDVVKTRMAIQSTTNGAAPYPSVLSALYQIGRAEGVSGLQRGLYPGSFWQFSNVSVRFGVYGFFQRVAGAADDASPLRRYLQSLGLAGVSGGLAALVSNPFFIVKTRLQATSTDAALAVGQQHASGASGGVVGALAAIVRADGPAGLFRGLSAFAPRVIVASAVQLSTYDSVKRWVCSFGLRGDQLATHVASSFVTGAAVVAAMQPFDFAATRMVNSLSASEAGGAAAYASPLDVIRKTVATEGVRGVYNGGTANYLRFGPYCVLVFVFVERARQVEAYAVERWRG